MVQSAESVEWIQVRNDVEALMLEYSLIKQHRPRFNIRLRDDKSYPFLAITLERRVAAGDGDAGPEAQGHALLRSLRPRLRDPGDPRPAAAHVPGAHVLGQQVRAPPPPGPARACSSTSRSARARASATSRRTRTTRSWPSSSTSSTATPSRCSAGSTRTCGRRPTTSSSSGPPGCATGWPACRRRSRSRPSSPTGPRTST